MQPGVRVPRRQVERSPADRVFHLQESTHRSLHLVGGRDGQERGEVGPGNGQRHLQNTVPGSPPPSVRTVAGERAVAVGTQKLHDRIKQLEAEKKCFKCNGVIKMVLTPQGVFCYVKSAMGKQGHERSRYLQLDHKQPVGVGHNIPF